LERWSAFGLLRDREVSFCICWAFYAKSVCSQLRQLIVRVSVVARATRGRCLLKCDQSLPTLIWYLTCFTRLPVFFSRVDYLLWNSISYEVWKTKSETRQCAIATEIFVVLVSLCSRLPLFMSSLSHKLAISSRSLAVSVVLCRHICICIVSQAMVYSVSFYSFRGNSCLGKSV
jgi:hypothetical protein